MKLLLVKEHLKLTRGGAERSTAELADCLVELGHEVTVAAATIEMDDTVKRNWQVLTLTLEKAHGRAGRWQAFCQQVRHLREANLFDVVHSMEPVTGVDFYQPRGGSIAAGALRHADTYAWGWQRRLKRMTLGLNRGRAKKIAAEANLCRRSETVILALSDYAAGPFRDLYGVTAERLVVVRNGIVPDRFRDEATRVQAARLRQVVDRQNHLAVLVFAAENLQLKGLCPLIEAAAMAKARRPADARDFRILVVSRENYTAYWAEAQRLGVGAQIVFVGPTQEMNVLLAMCDGVILPTYHDACSRVVLESLAAGKPVVTTRYNGAADFVRPEYGVVVDSPEDCEALADGILALCDREHQAAMCARIEADKVYEEVSMRRHARELTAVYESKMVRISNKP